MAYAAGSSRTTRFHWDNAQRTLSWTVAGSNTTSAQMFSQVQLVLFDKGGRADSGSKALGVGGSIVAPHQTA